MFVCERPKVEYKGLSLKIVRLATRWGPPGIALLLRFAWGVFFAAIVAVVAFVWVVGRFIDPLLYFNGFHALQTHRLAHWLLRKGRRDFAFYLQSRSSAVFHTSTSGVSSVLLRVAVGGAGTCSLMPKKTRFLSSLHESAPRSLTTQPFGNPSALDGSSVAGVDGASPIASCMFGNAISTLSRSRIFSTSLPLSTATAVPSSFQASLL